MASRTMKWRRLLGAVPAATLWLIAVGCTEENWGEPHATGTGMSSVRPECPQTWARIPLYPAEKQQGTRTVVGSGGTVSGDLALAAPGPITDMPEFHDCQKFIIAGTAGQPATYGALFAIFAAFKLDSIVDALPQDGVTWSSANSAVATVSSSGDVTAVGMGTTSIIATSTADPTRRAALAIVVVASAPPVVPTPVTVSPYTPALTVQVGQTFPVTTKIGKPTEQSLPAAEIYTYGPGYEPLGIGPNFNCLYLFFDSTGNFSAKMVNIPTLGPSAKACFGAADPRTAAGKILHVIRTADRAPDEYPAVARWDWDPVNKLQYIGIKCGAGWCEVGAPGTQPFTVSASYRSSGSVPAVVAVKGWYDEQYLAFRKGTADLLPSRLKATTIPDPELKTRTEADYKTHTWYPVAHVGLDGSDDTEAASYYKTKFNFDVVPVKPSLTGMNTISMCYGTRTECSVPTPQPPAVGCGPDSKPPFFLHVRRWWARIDPALGGRPKYRCVVRRDHQAALAALGIELPHTTRWRWQAADETHWEYCPFGCCEVQDDSKSLAWF